MADAAGAVVVATVGATGAGADCGVDLPPSDGVADIASTPSEIPMALLSFPANLLAVGRDRVIASSVTFHWRPSYLILETSSFASPPHDGFAFFSAWVVSLQGHYRAARVAP